MRHRITVLGAGYAGASAAGYLARHLHPDDVEITVLNAEADFVERMRLHQVAAGRPPRRRALAAMFAGTGVRLRVARVTGIDTRQRNVEVNDGEGHDRIRYDTLLYTGRPVGSQPPPDGQVSSSPRRPPGHPTGVKQRRGPEA